MMNDDNAPLIPDYPLIILSLLYLYIYIRFLQKRLKTFYTTVYEPSCVLSVCPRVMMTEMTRRLRESSVVKASTAKSQINSEDHTFSGHISSYNELRCKCVRQDAQTHKKKADISA
jgi:hypothetical protein